MASSKIILLFSFTPFLCSAISEAQPTYLSHACSSNKTFTAKSAFQSNLNTVLSSLSSANADFYNTTVAGEGDTAYGLFMCRGDVTLDVCHQCVVEATQRLTSDCQFSKEAVIWYDECMLRYSNTSFFSTVDTRMRLGLLNTSNIANPGSFMNRKDSAWRWQHGPPTPTDQMGTAATDRTSFYDGVFKGPIYSSHACTDSITYQPKATFEINLNLLLFSLPSKASDGSHFYRIRSGEAAPNAVNGLFLCRGDTVAAACRECVSAAAGEIKRRCPVQKEAIIWYDDCMLRYSNQSFNRIVPSTDLSNTDEVAAENKERFDEVLSGLLNSVAAKVLKSPTKFATEQVNFTRTETLYALEQCTPDLTAFDCNTCLRSAIAAVPNCCDVKRGTTVLLPACNIRYEFYRFFKQTPPAPVPHSRP